MDRVPERADWLDPDDDEISVGTSQVEVEVSLLRAVLIVSSILKRDSLTRAGCSQRTNSQLWRLNIQPETGSALATITVDVRFPWWRRIRGVKYGYGSSDAINKLRVGT